MPAVSISYVVYEQTKKQYVILGYCVLLVRMQTYHPPLALQAWRLNPSTFRNFMTDSPVVHSLALFPSCIDLANIVLVRLLTHFVSVDLYPCAHDYILLWMPGGQLVISMIFDVVLGLRILQWRDHRG